MTQRVRLKMGEHEIEVEGDSKFIDKQIERFLKLRPIVGAAISRPDLPSQIAAQASAPPSISARPPAPAEYFRLKKPRGGTERLLVLGRYLQEYRGKEQFTRNDIGKLSAEARVNDVHGQYFTLAIKQGLLRTVGKGTYSLTISGEDAVAAMPAPPKSR